MFNWAKQTYVVVKRHTVPLPVPRHVPRAACCQGMAWQQNTTQNYNH